MEAVKNSKKRPDDLEFFFGSDMTLVMGRSGQKL